MGVGASGRGLGNQQGPGAGSSSSASGRPVHPSFASSLLAERRPRKMLQVWPWAGKRLPLVQQLPGARGAWRGAAGAAGSAAPSPPPTVRAAVSTREGGGASTDRAASLAARCAPHARRRHFRATFSSLKDGLGVSPSRPRHRPPRTGQCDPRVPTTPPCVRERRQLPCPASPAGGSSGGGGGLLLRAPQRGIPAVTNVTAAQARLGKAPPRVAPRQSAPAGQKALPGGRTRGGALG